jgi:hypothetical protein
MVAERENGTPLDDVSRGHCTQGQYAYDFLLP